MGSALYNMGLGSGSIIGPILGGYLVTVGDRKQPATDSEWQIENKAWEEDCV
jgi:hypothetical protein